MRPGLVSRLAAVVGKDHVFSGEADTAVYAYDASLATSRPEAVVFPGDTAEVARVVRLATRLGVPILPRGFGTNLSGGTIPAHSGLIICLSRLNRILEIQPELGVAVVQPGVTNLELQDALSPHGFFYAPDPASQKVATLGGNVGENSGGPRCVKYGVTQNHVLGLEVVLPGGDVLRLGGSALDPPGYDLRGLLIGSEGTLGIVTEVTVRILPCPESVITLLAVYDRIPDAAGTVSEIMSRGIQPSALEMMDNPVMRAVEAGMPCGYPLDADAVLIIEVDGPVEGLDELAGRIRAICSRMGAREVRLASDAGERDRLWAGRRGALGAVARLAPNYLVADCTVPRSALPEALDRVAAIAAAHHLEHGNVFHAGDGNLHPLLFFDSRDVEQVRNVKSAGREIMEACVRLGGTISGEHGVGLEKIEAMRLVFSEESLDFQRRIKQAVDPENLLNPGKIFPKRKPSSKGVAPPAASRPFPQDLCPESAEEAVGMVREARACGQPLVPLGHGSPPDLPESGTVPIRSTRLDRVLEFSAANQTVRVQSGMRLARLQDFLADHGLWLPIRPLNGRSSTLGGLAAVNGCGPERPAYGAMQDRVLGLCFVCGRGSEIRAGGRVIKNVAGYDLCRLMVRSRGQLGFLTEVTLHLASRPQAGIGVTAQGPLPNVLRAAAAIRCSSRAPVSMTASPDAGGLFWTLHMVFEGLEKPIRAQASRCAADLASRGLEVASCPLEGPFHRFGRPEAGSLPPFRMRIDLPLNRLPPFLEQGIEPFAFRVQLLDLSCGRLAAWTPSLDPGRWVRIQEAARDLDGHAVLEEAPSGFRARNPPGLRGPAGIEALVDRLESRLDPAGIFAHSGNPFMEGRGGVRTHDQPGARP